MHFLVTAIAFIALMTVLVIIHELGHFMAARKTGVIVEEFGFGLPPRVKTLFWQGKTRFSLNWIPFGGFVRLQGENAMTDRERRAKGSFSNASIFARIIILTAGVFMNFLFAVVIFTVGFSAGRWIPTYLSFDDMQDAGARGEISFSSAVVISHLLPDGGAAKAGVPAGSRLLTVDSVAVTDPEDVPNLQAGKQQVSYRVLVQGEGEEPREEVFTVPVTDGKTGVGLAAEILSLSSPKRSVLQAFLLSLREAKVMTVQTVYGLTQLFRSLASSGTIPEGITGIVGIAQLTHVSVQEGLATYLRLVALLSLSLAVLNILPLPALDGGRLLFVLIEGVSRRPANRRFEVTTNAIGFAFLILLILLITYHDILQLF